MLQDIYICPQLFGLMYEKPQSYDIHASFNPRKWHDGIKFGSQENTKFIFPEAISLRLMCNENTVILQFKDYFEIDHRGFQSCIVAVYAVGKNFERFLVCRIQNKTFLQTLCSTKYSKLMN